MKKTPIRLAAALLALCLLAGCGAPPAAEPDDAVLLVPVSLAGGSGRAAVESPAEVRAENGQYTAVLRWSSPNYDYMLVDGARYEPMAGEAVSVFEIPIPAPPCTVHVQADTVAMSRPHLIDYTLSFGDADEDAEPTAAPSAAPAELPGLVQTGSMALDYAEQFTVDYYEGGYALVTVPADARACLLVPEGAAAPEDLPPSVSVLRAPVSGIYLAASAAMDFFAAADALSALRFVSQRAEAWSSEALRAAMAAGEILYAGKYSAPDYERICTGGCALAVENTMIYHAPEVRERLEELGVPVLVDHSSYETTPQGRMEWVRLYGLLTGHEAETERAYRAQLAQFEALEGIEPVGKTVAWFYLNSSGAAVVRRSEDYIPALIRLAGGDYAFPDLRAKDGAHSSSVAIQTEEFYAAVRDADFLIYSSDVTGAPASAAELIDRCPLLLNCRAVQEGALYCTGGDLYRSTMAMGDFVTELHRMLTEESPELFYLYRLE